MCKKIMGVAQLLIEVAGRVGVKNAEAVHEAFCEVMAIGLEILEPCARLGTRLHNAIWRQTPMIAVEIVAFTVISGKLYVWLARRKVGEAYAGLLHSLGTLLRASDSSLAAAVNRLAVGEFGFEPGSAGLQVLGLHDGICPVAIDYKGEERGMMFSLLFPAKAVIQPPGDGAWYSVADVLEMSDDEIIADHRDRLIPLAEASFLRSTEVFEVFPC